MKLLLISVLFLGLGMTALSQGRGPKTPEQLERSLERASFREKFEAANELFYQKNYYYSLVVFKNLAKEQPDNAHINYKIGVCYLNSNTDKTKALPHLIKAEKGISRNFDTYSHTDESAPYETYFYLGQAYHLDYQFDKSIENFELFKTKISKKHKLIHNTNTEISQCIVGKKMIANPRTDVKIRNLGPVVNSEFSDFSPVATLDGEVLYFTSRRVRKDSSNIDEFSIQDGKHYEDIYVTYRDENGEWGEPRVLSFSEVDRNEATIGVSADGAEIFAYVDDEGDGNIYYSVFQDTNFSELTKLADGISDINTDAWETHATVSPDGTVLYFVSDRKGGMGGRDIYMSRKLPNGDWGMAINLGPTINTPDDEDSPYIAADGKTMYFSSNGVTSMGGFDVFVTKLNEEGQWSKPVNMKYPVNTVDDDVFFIVNAEGNVAYFSSLHGEKTEGAVAHGKDAGYGEKDIYEVLFEGTDLTNVAIFKGKIIPKAGDPIPSTMEIYATDKTDGVRLGPYRPRQDDGGYVLVLKPCHDYLVEYFLDDKLFTESEFTVPCEADFQSIHTEIFLDPTDLDTGRTVVPASSIVRWKVIDAPLDMKGKQINYFDESGGNLGNVTIGDDLIFSYPNQSHDYTYRFEVDNQNELLCKSMCFALIDSSDKILGYAVRKENCEFFYEKLDTKWQLVNKKTREPVQKSNVKVVFKDAEGNISFEEKLGCNGMFAYHPLDANGNNYAMLDEANLGLCDEVEIVLLDKNNNEIGTTTRDEKCRFTYSEKTDPCNPIADSYEKFYGYNQKGIRADESAFNKFIDNVVENIKCHGTAKIEIESSASKVPTSTFKSNQALAQYRADDAKKRILERLSLKGYKSTQVKFISINAQVLGPNYKNDFKENKAVYGKYQYVKLKTK